MTNKEIITTALKSTGYYYDFATATLYMTADFEKNSNSYGTNEYRMLNRILDKFPNAILKVYKAKSNNLVTYKMMEDFIRAMPNAAANYAEYKRIKLQSRAHRSAYKFVSEWFKEKFPHYGKLLVVDKETGEIMWDALDEYKTAATEADARAAEKKAKTEVEAATLADASNLMLMENAG